MSVTVAEYAGFCFGVDRAVKIVEDLADSGSKVCTLGEIIHNPFMVKQLEAKGVRTIEEPSECRDDEIMVIRSHGVPKAVKAQAEKYALEVVDATCPFVKKIQNIADEESEKGSIVIIAGDPKHSEVIGIRGHCGESYVVSSVEDLEKLRTENEEITEKNTILVSQTTFNKKIFEKMGEIYQKYYTKGKIFGTICSATSTRQQEANELSARSDVMLVIGGRNSSNTKKLYDVCKCNCEATFFLESCKDLEGIDYKFTKGLKVGIVAGASTPAGIIKEVQQTMTEIENSVVDTEAAVADTDKAEVATEQIATEITDDMSFEEALAVSLNSMNSDQKVKGTVLSVNAGEVRVDIGRKYTGIIKANEFSFDPNVNLEEEVKPGDVLDLIIMRTNDEEGTIYLSKRRFDSVVGWSKVEEALESKAILEGKVAEINNGGIIVLYEGTRVFIPSSLATLRRSESIEDLKGTTVSYRIIEASTRGRRRRVIGSVKDVLLEQKKALEEKFWAEIEEGKKYTGVVKSLTMYGAFVDLGGVDGMIHITELSWTRIKHPSEVVNVGDTVEVYVKAIDTEKKKISLGFKNADENPWKILEENYSVDSVVKVKIVNVTSYGAFATIIPGIDGLIHISQIANKKVEKPSDELTVGEEVEAKIIKIDLENKRVSLSIRALLEPEEVEEAPEEVVEEAPVEEAVEDAAEELVYSDDKEVEAPVEDTEAPAEETTEE